MPLQWFFFNQTVLDAGYTLRINSLMIVPDSQIKYALLVVGLAVVSGSAWLLSSFTAFENRYQSKMEEGLEQVRQKKLIEARASFEAAFTEATKSDNPIWTTRSLLKLADVSRSMQQTARAKQFLQKAEQFAQSANLERLPGSSRAELLHLRMDVLQKLTEILSEDGLYQEADRQCMTALALAKEAHGSDVREDAFLQLHIELLQKQGKSDEAERLNVERLAAVSACSELYGSGKNLYEQKKLKEARGKLLIAAKIGSRSKRQQERVQTVAALSKCLIAMGRHSEATKAVANLEQAFAEPSAEISPTTGADRTEYLTIKACLLARTNAEEAKALFRSALKRCTKKAVECLASIVDRSADDPLVAYSDGMTDLVLMCDRDLGALHLIALSQLLIGKRSESFQRLMEAAANLDCSTTAQGLDELCRKVGADPARTGLTDLCQVLDRLELSLAKARSDHIGYAVLSFARVADIYRVSRDYPKAERYGQRAIALVMKSKFRSGKEWKEQYSAWNKLLGQIYLDAGKAALAESCMQTCLKFTTRDDMDEYMWRASILAGALSAEKKYAQCSAVLNNAISLASAASKPNFKNIGDFESRLAEVALAQGQDKLAKEHYKKAFDLIGSMRHQYEKQRDSKKTLNDLAEYECTLAQRLGWHGMYDLASVCWRDCLRDSTLDGDGPSRYMERVIWQTDTLLGAGRLSEAEAVFESADKEFVRNYRSKLSSCLLASFYMHWAIIDQRRNRVAESISRYEMACQFWRAAETENLSVSGAYDVQESLASCEANIASQYRDQRDVDRSVGYWQKALEHTPLERKEGVERYVFRCVWLAGTLSGAARLKEADAVLQRAGEVATKHAHETSDAALAQLYYTQASLAQRQGNAQEAERRYVMACKLFRATSDSRIYLPQAEAQLACLLASQYDLGKRKSLDACISWFQKSLDDTRIDEANAATFIETTVWMSDRMLNQKSLSRAELALDKATAVAEQFQTKLKPRSMAYLHLGLIRLHRSKQEFDKAIEHALVAQKLFADERTNEERQQHDAAADQMRIALADCETELATLFQATGRPAEAERWWLQAVHHTQPVGGEVTAYLLRAAWLSDTLKGEKKSADCEKTLLAALKVAGENQAVGDDLHAQLYLRLAETSALQNRAAAKENYQKACELFVRAGNTAAVSACRARLRSL